MRWSLNVGEVSLKVFSRHVLRICWSIPLMTRKSCYLVGGKMTSMVAPSIYVNIGKNVLMKLSGLLKRFWKKSFLILKFLRKGQFLPFRVGQHISLFELVGTSQCTARRMGRCFWTTFLSPGNEVPRAVCLS